MHRRRLITYVLKLTLRSEEHTSEPSHTLISYAVFCLKKKQPRGRRGMRRRLLVRASRDPAAGRPRGRRRIRRRLFLAASRHPPFTSRLFFLRKRAPRGSTLFPTPTLSR